MAERPLVAVTDHAAERFRQRVGSRRGLLDVRPELATRVADAVAADRVSRDPPPGSTGARGSLYVRDGRDPHVIYVCRREGSELVVVTLWEDESAPGGARVPRRFTDALRTSDAAVRDWTQRDRDRDR
jgi:hypothetical protein